jgi:hypothetical protein
VLELVSASVSEWGLASALASALALELALESASALASAMRMSVSLHDPRRHVRHTS